MKTSADTAVAPVEIRRRAEAQLRTRSKRRVMRGAPKSAADTGRLLHELQVHQVELEMQNEELQKNRDEMEAGLEKYSDLYDFAPVGYFTFTATGIIQQVNLVGASLVGIERSRLVGQSFGRLVTPEQRPVFNSFLQSVFAGQNKQAGEFALLRPGHLPRFVNIEARCSPDRQECRLAVMDITVRKQAEEALRASEERYRILFELGPVAVYAIDVPGVIQNFNPRAAELWGRRPALGDTDERFCGSYKLFRPDGSFMPHEQSPMAEVVSGKIPGARDMEVLIERPDGSRITVVVNIRPLKNDQGEITGAVNCFYDITERKAAEIALGRLAAIVEFSDDGIIGKDTAGRITSWNHGAEKIFGHAAREMVGASIMRLVPPGRREEENRILAKIKSGKGVQHLETVRKTRDGRLIQVSITSSPIKDATGRISGASQVVRDITARKLAEGAQRRLEVMTASNQKLEREIIRRRAVEESLLKSERHQIGLLAQSNQLQDQLRRLSRQILSVQEDERKRISRELHDVIAQTLTGINVRLSALKKEAALNSRHLARDIARTQRLVEKSVNTVHDFARELRPPVLDDLGLIPALYSFVKLFSKRTRLHVRLTAFAGVEKIDINKRTILYRVAQEALTNVSRHAQASRVEVGIQKLPHGIGMKIHDNGKSFAVDSVLKAKGGKRLGLLGMRERLEMVGGTFCVESASGKGTTIIAQIPFGKAVGGGVGWRR